MRHDPHEDPPRRSSRSWSHDRVATLAEMQGTPGKWVWVYCERCNHSAPMAVAPLVIRWGPRASSDQLRRSARCTACGHKGATLRRVSWVGNDVEWQPFPG